MAALASSVLNCHPNLMLPASAWGESTAPAPPALLVTVLNWTGPSIDACATHCWSPVTVKHLPPKPDHSNCFLPGVYLAAHPSRPPKLNAIVLLEIMLKAKIS